MLEKETKAIYVRVAEATQSLHEMNKQKIRNDEIKKNSNNNIDIEHTLHLRTYVVHTLFK